LIVAKFNTKPHYNKSFSLFQPFCPRLPSNFVKSANMVKQKFNKNAVWVSRNAEFDADFQSGFFASI
jgi:hypothetical protein